MLNGEKYIDAPEEERKKAFAHYALPKNIDAMHDNLDKYKIHYDERLLEPFLQVL